MKVSELIKRLQKADQDREVILSNDEEGNGFGYLMDIHLKSTFDGDSTYHEELTPELIDLGFTEDDVSAEHEKVVVLWP